MRLVFLAIILSVIPTHGIHAETLEISTDSSKWYPYTYEENGKSKGMHIDIVTQALKNLGHKAAYSPLPWKRCLRMAQTGKYNAVISASYKPERSEYMYYPPDAAFSSKSKWRITQVEYVVVTHIDSHYVFEGDIKTLPKPVRAPLGYSVVDDLEAKGIKVTTAPNITDNMVDLVRLRRGVVITPPTNVKLMQQDPRFSNQLRIHEVPFVSKSYFMPFSKKNPKVNQEEMVRIWKEIARLRDDEQFMRQLTIKYQLKGQ